MSDLITKVKWKPRRPTLPETLICSQTEAIDLLRRQLFDDAIAAGWLQPCCQKGNVRDAATKLYAVSAVQLVAHRVLGGEYPAGKAEGGRRKAEGGARS